MPTNTSHSRRKKPQQRTQKTTRAREIRESLRPIVDLERDADHRYWFRREGSETRQEALSVTRSLIEANLIDDQYFNDRVRGRGRLAHLIAERILSKRLNGPIDSEILPYMLGLRKWLDKEGPTVVNAEVMLCNPNLLLAGTVDIDIILERSPAVVELKLSEPTPWHGLQLAAYAYLLDGPHWMRRRRFGLYLRANGGYRFKEYDNVTDLDYFMRAFEILHWRVLHGSYERPYGRLVGDGGTDSLVLDGAREWRDGLDGDSSDF